MKDGFSTLRQQRNNAQRLRKNLTKEERHLWYDFLKTYPVQFRRQYGVGNFIVDFYCYEARLVVELDGSQHYDPICAEQDRKRTAFIESKGLAVLRFSNADVMRRFSGVCQQIDETVKMRISADLG